MLMNTEKIIKKLTQNKFVTYELGDKLIGENEIGDVCDGKVYVYNTLTSRCSVDVENWLKDLLESDGAVVSKINCCCGEDYFEIKKRDE